MSDVRTTVEAPATPDSDLQRAARTGGTNLLAYLAGATLPLLHVSLTNVFGAAVYGLYVSAAGILEVAARVAMCGADIGLLRYVAIHRAAGEQEETSRAVGTALRVAFVTGVVLAVGVALSAEPIAAACGKPEVGGMLVRLAAAIPFAACAVLLVVATLAAQRARVQLLVRGLGEPLGLLAIAMAVAAVWPTAAGLAAAHLVTAVLVCAVAAWAFGRIFGRGSLAAALRAPSHGDLLRFSLPTSVAEILLLLLQRADLWILLYYVGEVELGIYAGAEFIGRAVANVRYAFDSVACPLLAEAHRAGDRSRLARHLALLSRWVTLLSLPMVIVIATFRTEILSLFGPEFPRASGPFVWLLVAHFANGVLGLTGWVIAMTGRTRWLIVNALVGVASNLALNFALVPRYGIEGAAWAALASLLLFRGLEAAEAFFFERAHIVSAPLLRALAAGGIALGSGLFARELWSDAPALGLVAIAAAQVIVYAVCVAWFRPALEDQKLLARVPLLSAILRGRRA